MKDLEKRKRVMRRSMRLGHCICNPGQACPCEEFTNRDICHCAGEARPAPEGPVRLTQMVVKPRLRLQDRRGNAQARALGAAGR